MKTFLKSDDNEEIHNALMQHILKSMDFVGVVRLQCYDKLYESYESWPTKSCFIKSAEGQ